MISAKRHGKRGGNADRGRQRGPLNHGVLRQQGVAIFRPNGATGCSHGWSGAAALRPDAEPVESGYPLSSFRPGGATEIFGPTKRRLCPALPPPLAGRMC